MSVISAEKNWKNSQDSPLIDNNKVAILCLYGHNIDMESLIKKLLWIGSAKKDLMTMPSDVKDTFGYALHQANARNCNTKA